MDQAPVRSDVTFDSWGGRCAAWLYRPTGHSADSEPFPCVVMAHGWTGVREQTLDLYAERFASAGIGALVFDYRHFGSSEGEPRQLLSINEQLADWAAALAYARARPEIDDERIAVWGTSFSGGHVLATAERDHRVAAVISQIPFTDGLANLRYLGVGHALRLTLAGLIDLGGSLVGRPPHMVSSVGPPGSAAVMNTPGAEDGFHRIDPQGSTWRNEAAARIALAVSRYRPGLRAGAIRCPVLYCIGDRDVITPPGPALAAAARTPRAEIRRYPIDHFDIYVGEWFERAVADQTEFLARVLLGTAREVAATTGGAAGASSFASPALG